MQELSYAVRAELATNPLVKRIFNLIEKKRSNLCVAVDVTNSAELLRLADQIGASICILKVLSLFIIFCRNSIPTLF